MSDLVFIPQLKPYFWRPLYYFYYVAYFGSYSKAALALHISRPSLTRAVQVLEVRLKVPLFVRSTRHVRLTEEGLCILEHAKHLLGRLKKIEQFVEARALYRPLSLHLWVAAPLLGDYWIDALLGFQLSHPEIALTIYPGHVGLAQRSSLEHQLHIRVGFEPGSRWVQKPLLGFEGALYASEGYLKQWGLPLSLEDLSEHRLLLLNATIPGVFEDMNWHASLLGPAAQKDADYLIHSPEHLIRMAEADFGIMAWIKGDPALKDRAVGEILEEVSALQGPQSQAYFACEASSFELEGVQALYLYVCQHVQGLAKE
jgi:DNA-binding transcriptional LysR family regulator